jgi:hypothetical protein
MERFTASMKGLLIVGAAAISIVAAPTAHADEASFVQDVQQHMPSVFARYGPDAIAAEGYRICVYEQWRKEWERLLDEGQFTRPVFDWPQEYDRIALDMPMSQDDVDLFTAYAERHLC